jgi:hypothetical protein
MLLKTIKGGDAGKRMWKCPIGEPMLAEANGPGLSADVVNGFNEVMQLTRN